MVALGLLLIVVAVIFGADIVLENTGHVTGTMFHQTVSRLSLGGVFLAGAVTALVLALGLWLLFGGAARARRKRVQRRERLRETSAQRETLAQENERLARALEEERQRATAPRTTHVDEGRGSHAADEVRVVERERRVVE